MKILIVDDEQPARQRLLDLLQELDEEFSIQQAANGEEALQLVNAQDVDIILLDIRMPVMDGLETAQHIGKLENPPAIVFTTAYEEHALAAFDANAIDYLLKPIRPQRLQQAIAKASALSKTQLNNLQDATDDTSSRQHLSVSSHGKIELIPVNQILCFRAEQKYVSIFLADKEILTDESLKRLENEFADQFLRIHRNALVALSFIEALDRDAEGNNMIKLKGMEMPLLVSRRHLKEVKAKLKNL